MSADHEAYEEKEHTEPDNINVGLVGTVTVVGAVLTLSIALALTALVRNEASSHSDEVGAFADLGTVARLKAAQEQKLAEGPTWAKKGDRLVALPIDRAMNLVTADIRKNPALATKPPPGEEEMAGPDAGADGGSVESIDEEGPTAGQADDAPALPEQGAAPKRTPPPPAPPPGEQGKKAPQAPKKAPAPQKAPTEQPKPTGGAMPAPAPEAPAAPQGSAKGLEN